MATSKQVVLTADQTTTLIENTTTDKMLEVLIKTNENIWIGGADITNDDGYKVNAFGTEKIKLSPEDILYGYSLDDARIYILSTELLISTTEAV